MSTITCILSRRDRCAITPKSLTDIDKIWDKVREARRDGYSYASEEALIGEVVLAAVITNGNKQPIGAVHIAGSPSEWSVEDFRGKYAPLAIEAARALSG
jgi:IclR family transcriptional regulator, pca regulon regulatory protein